MKNEDVKQKIAGVREIGGIVMRSFENLETEKLIDNLLADNLIKNQEMFDVRYFDFKKKLNGTLSEKNKMNIKNKFN